MALYIAYSSGIMLVEKKKKLIRRFQTSESIQLVTHTLRQEVLKHR